MKLTDVTPEQWAELLKIEVPANKAESNPNADYSRPGSELVKMISEQVYDEVYNDLKYYLDRGYKAVIEGIAEDTIRSEFLRMSKSFGR